MTSKGFKSAWFSVWIYKLCAEIYMKITFYVTSENKNYFQLK